MAFKILQKVDENGYWIKPVKFFIAPDSKPSKKMVEQALPEGADVQNNFYKWDGEKWVAEKKPTSAEELIGVVIKHSSRTERDLAVRKLIEKFAKEDGYRIRDRSANLDWELEKIPEEEIELQAINAELSTFDQKVASLKDRLATATLQDDAETVASLKAEYKILMGD